MDASNINIIPNRSPHLDCRFHQHFRGSETWPLFTTWDFPASVNNANSNSLWNTIGTELHRPRIFCSVVKSYANDTGSNRRGWIWYLWATFLFTITFWIRVLYWAISPDAFKVWT